LASLFDIAPATESVTISGHAIPVYGISASSILQILGRFPELVDAYREGETDILKMLLRHGGSALAALIAAACGEPGNPQAEKHAAMLPADAQLQIAASAVRLTMPEGATPFLQRVGDLLSTFGLSASEPQSNSISSPAPAPIPAYSNGHAANHHGSNGAAVQ
jgi:hypothetical protein